MSSLIKGRYSIILDSQKREVPEDGLELFDLIVNDGDVRPYSGGMIPPHWHPEIELFVVTEGSIGVGIGENIYPLQAGDGCFINSEILHSFTPLAPSLCHYHSFVFDPGIVGGAPGSIFDTMYVRPLLENGPSYLQFHSSEDAYFFDQFQYAFSSCEKMDEGYEFQVRHAFSNILLYVKQHSDLVPSHTFSSPKEDRLKQMISWIDEHLTSEITLKSLAASANICTRECQRLFARYLHYTPTEYIRRRRLFFASEEIASTALPITEIALSYGFPSPSYFSKQFKSVFGSSPSEYRILIQSHQNVEKSKKVGE